MTGRYAGMGFYGTISGRDVSRASQLNSPCPEGRDVCVRPEGYPGYSLNNLSHKGSCGYMSETNLQQNKHFYLKFELL